MESSGRRCKSMEVIRSMSEAPRALHKRSSSVDAISHWFGREEFRIVMIGKTGSGKSASANTILGRKEFKSTVSSSSVTKECEKRQAQIAGWPVAVVDTPGLFDTTMSKNKVTQEIVKCINMSSPGPHAFLLVIAVGRFTKEERQTVEKIEKMFGENVASYSMILFTRADDLEDKTIEKFLEENADEDLKKIVRKCKNRYHTFNNKLDNPQQVRELLKKIQQMVEENGCSHYTNDMYMRVEEMMRQKEEELKKKYDEDLHSKEEELRAKYKKDLQMVVKDLTEKYDKLETEMKEKDERIKTLEKKDRELMESLKIQQEENKQNHKEKLRNVRAEAEKSNTFKPHCNIL